MFEFGIGGIGFIAPGLPSWQAALAVLRGERQYNSAPLQKPVPALLPANERRRVSPMVKLCLMAAEEAMPIADEQPPLAGAVFSSSSSDLQMAHKICTAARLPGHPVSPTDFHNSVHNAASGYWSIATGQRVPTSSITAGGASFSAGLLDAVTMLQTGAGSVLLVCFEWPPSAPLGPATTLLSGGAVALLLSADECCWQLQLTPEALPETRCSQVGLEALRLENPAMRALPFLTLLSTNNNNNAAVLAYVNGMTLQVSRR